MSQGGVFVSAFRCFISHIYDFYTNWSRAGPQPGDSQCRCSPPPTNGGGVLYYLFRVWREYYTSKNALISQISLPFPKLVRKDFKKCHKREILSVILDVLYPIYTIFTLTGVVRDHNRETANVGAPPLRQTAAAFHIVYLEYGGEYYTSKNALISQISLPFPKIVRKDFEKRHGGRFCQRF